MCLFEEEIIPLSEGQSLHSSVRRWLFSCTKGFVSSNTAHCNQWAINNFESWKSQVAVEESFPHDVLLTDDPKLLCSCLLKYVSNTAFCNKLALNNFE